VIHLRMDVEDAAVVVEVGGMVIIMIKVVVEEEAEAFREVEEMRTEVEGVDFKGINILIIKVEVMADLLEEDIIRR
jgi:hypothetical protein